MDARADLCRCGCGRTLGPKNKSGLHSICSANRYRCPRCREAFGLRTRIGRWAEHRRRREAEVSAAVPRTKEWVRWDLNNRRMWILRERGDACEFCGWARFGAAGLSLVNVHHIEPVRFGGGNGQENLVALCPNHHAVADAGPRMRSRADLFRYLWAQEHAQAERDLRAALAQVYGGR